MIVLNDSITFSVRDEYNRKNIAKKIISLLDSNIPISPMIIDGGWGTGKTEFSYKLINLYKSENSNSDIIYVDSFKADHSNEPIMMILAAIVKLFPENEKEKIISKALPALRFGVKTLLKAGTGWILKQNTNDLIEEFQDVVKETSEAAINGTVESLLQDHIDADKNILALKNTLEELTKNRKLTILIDELDRCRPDFAISVLENIKHVFDIENLKFILVTNTQQLQASINKSYGHSLDAKRYLNKFIKFTCTLPIMYKNYSNEDVPISARHFTSVCENNQILAEFRHETGEIIYDLIKSTKLSLREVETLCRYIEIYQITSDNPLKSNTIFGYKLLIVLSIYLYCFYNDIALAITEGNIDIDKISSSVGLNKVDYNIDEYTYQIAFCIYGLHNETLRACESFPQPSAEQKQHWDRTLVSFFSGTYRNNHYSTIIKNIIKDLQLLSN